MKNFLLDSIHVLVYYVFNTLASGAMGVNKTVKFDDNLPIYTQIMHLIKTEIAAGKLSGGDKLPSVREFAKEVKVNPNTIQRSYQELEREGLVFTQRGMGTFVTEDQEKIRALKMSLALSLTDNFVREMESLGFNTEQIAGLITERTKEDKHE